MKDRIINNGLISTILGIIIILFSLYQIYNNNEVGNYIPLLVIGLGLIATKDRLINIKNNQ